MQVIKLISVSAEASQQGCCAQSKYYCQGSCQLSARIRFPLHSTYVSMSVARLDTQLCATYSTRAED